METTPDHDHRHSLGAFLLRHLESGRALVWLALDLFDVGGALVLPTPAIAEGPVGCFAQIGVFVGAEQIVEVDVSVLPELSSETTVIVDNCVDVVRVSLDTRPILLTAASPLL